MYGSSPKLSPNKRNHTQIKKFKVITEPGATVEVKCKGDCEGVSKVKGDQLEVTGNKLDIKRLFGDNKLLAKGTKIQILVTKSRARSAGSSSTRSAPTRHPRAGSARCETTGDLTDCS